MGISINKELASQLPAPSKADSSPTEAPKKVKRVSSKVVPAKPLESAIVSEETVETTTEVVLSAKEQLKAQKWAKYVAWWIETINAKNAAWDSHVKSWEAMVALKVKFMENRTYDQHGNLIVSADELGLNDLESEVINEFLDNLDATLCEPYQTAVWTLNPFDGQMVEVKKTVQHIKFIPLLPPLVKAYKTTLASLVKKGFLQKEGDLYIPTEYCMDSYDVNEAEIVAFLKSQKADSQQNAA